MNKIPSVGERGATSLPFLRGFLLVILLVEMLGIALELLLSDHFEDIYQWIPLAAMAVACLVLGVWALVRRPAVLRLFRLTMFLFMISGAAGMVLHYNAKAEFQVESDPSLGGMELFWKAIRTISPPALAPGVMIQMALLGLAFTYGHPSLNGKN